MIGIIGGSGFYDPQILTGVAEKTMGTPFGSVTMYIGRYHDRPVVFLPRHGSGHTIPPHRVNYRANIWALKSAGARRVLASAAVGGINEKLLPGDAVIVDQFIDFTKSRPSTFFEGGEFGVAHVDFTEPYCPEIRQALSAAARAAGLRVHDGGCYACMEGPRFETPAEIRMLKRMGADIVGMTSVPEVVLAREAGLCYGTVAMVTNHAAGLSGHPLSHQEVLELMGANEVRLRNLLAGAMDLLPEERKCACGNSPALPGI